MSSVSEYTLFKQAIETPRRLDKNFSQLNLQFVKDPAEQVQQPGSQDGFASRGSIAPDGAQDSEVNKRKTLRLMQNVWSGVTKCLRNMVQGQRKAVEIPGLGIFGALMEKEGQLRDPLDKGIANKNRESTAGKSHQGSLLSPVLVVINEDLLTMMEQSIQLDQSTDKAVGVYNKFEKREVNELFYNSITALNCGSIAKVCFTDAQTVELVLQEIIAQLAQVAKEGKVIRLNFKVGYIVIKSGILQWQHSRELLQRHGLLGHGQNVLEDDLMSNNRSRQASQPGLSHASVATPSVAAFSKNSHSSVRSFHVSNPNPQNKNNKFKSVHEIIASRRPANEIEQNALDQLKFGKKVVFGKNEGNKEVLESHLQQMREHLDVQKFTRESKLKEEREQVKKVKQEMDAIEQNKVRSMNTLKNEFLFFNDQKKQDNRVVKDFERKQKVQDKYDHFPFISGEMLEEHRHKLGGQLKDDLKQYITSKAGLSHNGSYGAISGANTQNSWARGVIQSPGASQNGSISATPSSRLTKNTAVTASNVKSLFDSCYVKPEQNVKVMQDSHPHKAKALQEALNRYENSVNNTKQQNKQIVEKHFARIDADNRDFQIKQEVHKAKTNQVKQQLNEQIENNYVRKTEHTKFEKLPFKTNFGPEESEHDQEESQQRNKKQVLAQRQHLQNQITEKQTVKRLTRENEVNSDLVDLDKNAQAMRMLDQQRSNEKNDVKNFWNEQLKSKKELKKKEDDANHELKKKIELSVAV